MSIFGCIFRTLSDIYAGPTLESKGMRAIFQKKGKKWQKGRNI